MWNKEQPALWRQADASFSRDGKGGWRIKSQMPDRWKINLGDLNFYIKLSPFKHTGIFPEQLNNWQWLAENCKKAKQPLKVLNLFGYTGGATLACAQAGAEVAHVDGSKSSITWAKDNTTINNLANAPIRWLLDDALSFVKRDIRRGRRYDGIIMDPPAFGHGPEGEVWKIEEQLPELISLLPQILSPKPHFILLNGYASGYSPLAYHNNLVQITSSLKGSLESGELGIAQSNGRILPAGIYCRWGQ